MLIPTAEYIEQITRGDYQHEEYALAVAKSDAVLLHSEGKALEEHIKRYRPNTPEYMADFQMANAREVTKSYFRKVQTVISQVLDAEDFQSTYTENDAQAQDLKQYQEERYPYWGSMLVWYRSEALHAKLTEPNGVYAIVLKAWEIGPGEEPRPYVKAFRAEQVLDYVDGHLCVVKLDKPADGEKCTYLVYTRSRITKLSIVQDGNSDRVEATELVSVGSQLGHGLGFMPAKKIGGQMFSLSHPGMYESWISGALPFWDEALVQSFDLQVNTRAHAYMEKIVYVAEECVDCKGSGSVAQPGLRGARDRQTSCRSCGGTGSRLNPGAPSYTHIVRPARQNEQPAPNPHVSYIDKPMEPLQFLKQDRMDNIVAGLAALNMEHLAIEPLNQSGKAKEVDRQPLYQYLATLAYDQVNDLRTFDLWIAGMRYVYTNPTLRAVESERQEPDGRLRYELVRNEQAATLIQATVPTRVVPRKFSVMSETAISQEIERARANDVDEMIISEMEIQLAEKKFSGDAEILPLIRVKHELDPLPGMNSDEKVAAKMQGAVREDDYILSVNITGFVRRAVDEQPNFLTLKTAAEKRKALQPYIDAVKAESQAGLAMAANASGMAQEAGGEADMNIEAQVKPRGYVGGFQGIVEIAKAIADGFYDLDAGINLVMVSFGYTREQAAAVLGTPQRSPAMQAEIAAV